MKDFTNLTRKEDKVLSTMHLLNVMCVPKTEDGYFPFNYEDVSHFSEVPVDEIATIIKELEENGFIECKTLNDWLYCRTIYCEKALEHLEEKLLRGGM